MTIQRQLDRQQSESDETATVRKVPSMDRSATHGRLLIGPATAHTMVLEYRIANLFADPGIWAAPGGSFDWTSPVHQSPASSDIGNGSGLVANRGGTISGLSWTNNQTLWIRWVERNDTGDDHGLAIDNVSFSAARTDAVVPEPGSFLVWGGIGILGVGLVAKKTRLSPK